MMPRDLWSSCHKELQNWRPWSVVMSLGTPKREIQWRIKASAQSRARSLREAEWPPSTSSIYPRWLKGTACPRKEEVGPPGRREAPRNDGLVPLDVEEEHGRVEQLWRRGNLGKHAPWRGSPMTSGTKRTGASLHGGWTCLQGDVDRGNVRRSCPSKMRAQVGGPRRWKRPVSYTHLTLPTIYSV